MYKFSAFEFNDKEIDQIVELVNSWVHGLKVDQRTLTANVRKYARCYNLVPAPKNFSKYSIVSTYCDPLYDIPVEALWRAVKPMIATNSGFSITTHQGWAKLNITRKRDIQEIERVLLKLDMEGYITFQSAGNIWRITLKSE